MHITCVDVSGRNYSLGQSLVGSNMIWHGTREDMSMRDTKRSNIQPKQLGRESSSIYVCSSQLREASLQHMASMYITKPWTATAQPAPAHCTVETCVAGSASRWQLNSRIIWSYHRAQQQADGGLENQADLPQKKLYGHCNCSKAAEVAHHRRGCIAV